MRVRSALPLHTLCSADLHVQFCDGHEGSIEDASELHDSGSPYIGTPEEPSLTAPTQVHMSPDADLRMISDVYIILITTVFFAHKFSWA